MSESVWILGFACLILFCALKSIRQPGVAIGLLLCLFGLESVLQAKSAFFIDNSRYVNLGIGIVILVAAVFSFLRRPKSFFQISPVHWMVYILLLYAFLSLYWTLAPEYSRRLRTALPYYGTYLVLAPLLTRDKNALADGMKWALWIGVPIMLIMCFGCEWGRRGLILAKPYVTDMIIYNETRPLATATMGASLATICLVTDFNKAIGIWLRLAVFALGLYIAFKTESRGQAVAIIAIAVIIYPLANRAASVKGAVITVIGMSILGYIVYLLATNLELVRWQSEHVQEALEGRAFMSEILLNHWFDNFGIFSIIGYGAHSCWKVIGAFPHNLPVEIFFELGLVGFGLFLAMLLKSGKNCLTMLARYDSDNRARSNLIALIGLIGVSLAMSLKGTTLSTAQMLFFLLIWLDQQLAFKDVKDPLGKLKLGTLFVDPRAYDAMHPQQQEITQGYPGGIGR